MLGKIILVTTFLFHFIGTGQTNQYFSASYQYGHVFPTNRFLKGVNPEQEKINRYGAVSLRWGVQTDTLKQWHRLYKSPSFGFQAYVASFFEPDFVGTPIAISGFFQAPFVKKKSFEFGYDFSLGGAFNWKPFNASTNNTNLAIGARQSFYIEVGLYAKQRLSKRFEISEGVSLTHFSNGALQLPNLGINTLAPKISLRYNLYNPILIDKTFEKSDFVRYNSFDIIVFGGVKNVIFDSLNPLIVSKYNDLRFPAYGITGTFSRKIGRKSEIGIGITTTVDHSIDAQIAIEENDLEIVPTNYFQKIKLSVFPSYGVLVGPVTVILQPSFYLYKNPVDASSKYRVRTFQRLGIRYNFKNSLFLGMNLRAYNYHVSDLMEFNIGYRFARK